jgi:hypothetical protein
MIADAKPVVAALIKMLMTIIGFFSRSDFSSRSSLRSW